MFDWGPSWGSQIANFPFISLQAAALVGTLGIVITTGKGHGLLAWRSPARYGVLVGAFGFVLLGLTQQVHSGPPTAYLSTDILFISGLLGGWRGAAAGWVLMLCARALFGSAANLGAAAIDMFLLACAGGWMHLWLYAKDLTRLAVGDLAIAWCVKVGASIGSLLLLRATLLPQEVASVLLPARLLGAMLSLVTLTCLFLLLRREALDQQSMLRRQQQEQTDPLTGLPNRKALHDHVSEVLGASADTAHTLVTFELVNTGEMVRASGHDWSAAFWPRLVGALQQQPVAALLQGYRPRHFMFNDLTLALFLHDVSSGFVERSGLATHVLDELMHRSADAGTVVPQLRMGVAMGSSAAYVHAAPVLRDLALALQSDQRPVRYFHSAFAEQVALDEQIRLLLLQWVGAGAAPLAYQAKFDLESGALVGAEAILRFKDARGHLVPHALVLEVAQRNHLLIAFEWCAVQTVARAIGRAVAAGRTTRLSVNVSTDSLKVPGFGRRVVAHMRNRQLPIEQLALEITERSDVSDNEHLAANMADLSAAGVLLSLDDFGAGYSALSMLAMFPFDEVKIDADMVARIDQPRMRNAVALALLTAKRYDATLVAEGVETSGQRQALRALGIRYGQGGVQSHPMDLEELMA